MEILSKDYGLTALSRRVYIGNVKKNDLPELQQELRRLFIGKKDRLFLFMLCTSRRNKKREELQQLLRKLAGYVDANCGNDLAVLLSSGFAAWNRNRAPSPVPKGEPVAVKPLMIRGVRRAV